MENTLKELDEETAYWLGFIAADGYLHCSSGLWSVGLELAEYDIEHIKLFLQYLKEENRKIFERKERKTCGIRSYNKKFIHTLLINSIGLKKSYTLFASINLKYNRHFWRGYFDGDGGICYRKTKPNYPVITLTTASEELQQNWLDFLEHNNILCGKWYKDKRGKASNWTVSGTKTIKVLNLLYENCIISLKRKQEKYEVAKNFITKTRKQHANGKIYWEEVMGA